MVLDFYPGQIIMKPHEITVLSWIKSQFHHQSSRVQTSLGGCGRLCTGLRHTPSEPHLVVARLYSTTTELSGIIFLTNIFKPKLYAYTLSTKMHK